MRIELHPCNEKSILIGISIVEMNQSEQTYKVVSIGILLIAVLIFIE